MTAASGAKRFVLPPVVFLAIAMAMAGADVLLPTPQLIPSSFFPLAIIPAAAAVALAGWALLAFRRARTSLHPHAEPTALVTTGPYRLSRNPMYLALLLLLCAWGMALGSLAALAGPPLFVLAITRMFIRREESRLASQFGEAYGAYRRHVRRWI